MISFRRLAAAAAPFVILAFSGASPVPNGGAPAVPRSQLHLAWRAPAKASQYDAASTVRQDFTWQMSGALKSMAAMAGHPVDPFFVVEERTRKFSTPHVDAEVYVDDSYTRRHGGDHPTDTTVVRRERRQIIPFDQSGRYGLEPRLCKGEPALNDSDTHPATYKQCPASEATGVQQFEDPGDAALAELPVAAIDVGQSWTFNRPVAVGREFSSGTMTYVDTLRRVEQHGNQRVAVIDVTGSGRIDVPSDLQAKGFHTATMTFIGSAEFNLDQGTPGTQHYSGHVVWGTRIFGAHIGITLDEVYDGKPWSATAKR